MLTEFQGEPVAGGTYPALIWRTFIESALRKLPDGEPQEFAPPPSFYSSPLNVVLRDGRLRLDNGYCRNTQQVAFMSGRAPVATADCKPNEVDVPRVVGLTVAAARARLDAQPLTPVFVYKPALPGQRVGRVVAQYPRGGTLSSYDNVTVVLPKPLDGVVPRVVGLPAQRAHRRLTRAGLRPRVTKERGRRSGFVLSQNPRPGVAATRGMTVTIVVASG